MHTSLKSNRVLTKRKVEEVLDLLAASYPDAECALVHKNNWELIVAVVLSAQTTDISVNRATPELFRRWPNPENLASANVDEVIEILRQTGMYRTKSVTIIRLAQNIIERYDGEVPEDYDDLISLPGVGRKTANVVLSVGFGHQRIAVDTHVFRVSNRIGLCDESNVLKTELALMNNIPESRWSQTHHCLIWHGRRVCGARSPNCENCIINSLCLYIKK